MSDPGDVDLGALRDALEALEAAIERSHPKSARYLRPGLERAVLEQMAERLRPYELPADVAELYLWHDGLADGEPGVFVPQAFWGVAFFPLAFVFAVYEHNLELAADTGGWCPVWFPVVGDAQFGEFATLEPRRSEEAALLWSYHFTGFELAATYDSVLSLVTTTVALWEEGHLPRIRYDEPPVEGAQALIASMNPACFRDGRWSERRHTSEGFLRPDWLPEWKESLGWHGATEPLPEPVPIDRLPADAFDEPVPIRGVLRGRGGGGGWDLVEVTDATGTVLARISSEATDGYRFLHLSDLVVVWVVRLAAGPPDPMPPLDEALDPVAAAAIERAGARWRDALVGVRIAPDLH